MGKTDKKHRKIMEERILGKLIFASNISSS